MSGPRMVTFGCRLNAHESAAIAAMAGAQANATIVNTCAVTGEAERQARQAIRRAAREHPGAPIIVTGCAAQIAPRDWAALPGVTRVVGNAEKMRAETWARDAAPAPVGDIMAGSGVAAAPVVRFAGRARATVQVQQGCDHRCSFCIIPFGRGPSQSVPIGAVVEQVRAVVAAGHAEVVLTGVDIASYGADLPGAPSLGQMLRRLLALVPELPRLRLSSLDPAAIDRDLWALIGAEPRLMPHLHLSLQHGADVILKRMKRRHLGGDVRALVRRARSLRPGMAFGADVIAGFPTETEAHVATLMELIEECDVSWLHVFPFSARPGVPAARMPQLPEALVRERAARLRALGARTAARFCAGRVGRLESVLTERENRGHTEQFAPVRLTGAPVAPGVVRRLRVTGFGPDGLLAEVA